MRLRQRPLLNVTRRRPMRECMDASLATRGPRAPTRSSLRRRLARRTGLLVGMVGLVVFWSAAGAVSAEGDNNGGGKATSVTPAEGCPGDVVTLKGSGFSPSHRNFGEWNTKNTPRQKS